MSLFFGYLRTDKGSFYARVLRYVKWTFGFLSDEIISTVSLNIMADRYMKVAGCIFIILS